MVHKGVWAAAALLLAIAGAAPTWAGCKLGTIAELPVTMVGPSPLVHTKINGEDAPFIADSGAFFSSLTAASAAQYHLRTSPLPPGYLVMGVGGEATMEVATVKTFTLAGVPIPHVDFLVGGGGVGSVAVGLLGQNVLRLADVEYDLAGGMIRLMRPHDCDHVNLAYWATGKPYGMLDIRSDTRNPHTLGEVSVNGRTLRAMFDTGAQTSVLDVGAARRVGIRTDGPGVRPAGFSSGVGRRPVPTWIAAVDSFKISDEQIKNTHLRIGAVGLQDVDMLVGADFFLSHRVFVANSQHKLFFTYNGGPVFNLSNLPDADAQGEVPGDIDVKPSPAHPPASTVTSTVSAGSPAPGGASAEPADAEGFSRRGAALEARHDHVGAVAAFTRAIELAPGDARYLHQRATARLAEGRLDLAVADLDAALKLDPEDAHTRVLRASLRIGREDKPGGLSDLEAADKVATRESELRLEMAELYLSADALPAAVADFDLWITAHPDDSRRAQALNGRCWTRALANVDLAKALADCDGALRLMPRNASFLDSRALVRLRRGELDKAVADYDAVLAQEPKSPWSLYGRGLAKVRLGRKADGEADIGAATRLEPKLSARAKTLGLAP